MFTVIHPLRVYIKYIAYFFVLALYKELLKLPFPAGARATKELKQALLSKDLIRAVNTHKLVETSASGSRRTCYFPCERIEDYTKKY